MTTDYTPSPHAQRNPRSFTATLTSVSYALVLLLGTTTGAQVFSAPQPDVQSAPLVVPDCPDGYGWVPPGDGLSYSHCRNAGPLTTTKHSRGMLAPDVCALNAAAGYTWNASDRTCSVAVAPPPVEPPIDTGGGGGGGDGGYQAPGPSGSKVICTEFYQRGELSKQDWMATLKFADQQYSPQILNGYHAWGVQYVRLMRNYPIFVKLAYYPTKWMTDDAAYRSGASTVPSVPGWILRELWFRPMCWTLGLFVKPTEWQSLWTRMEAQVANEPKHPYKIQVIRSSNRTFFAV